MGKEKINRKELTRKKARLSYLQIVILITSSFAIAYLIAMTDAEVVSATPTVNCCPVDKEGSPCNNYLSTECAGKCSTGCQLMQCNQFVDCKEGCCYDDTKGTCESKATKAKCELGGGIWKDSADCNPGSVPECKLGCCVIGSESEFVTEKQCESDTEAEGKALDFRAGVTTEVQCLGLSTSLIIGACLLEDNGCKMLTGQECKALTGKSIKKDTLCTSKTLNTTCKPTENTVCIDGKEGVYFTDSCGNPANIYDASKAKEDSYWEKMIARENSCNNNSINGNVEDKDCGNCEYVSGSKCKNYLKAGTDKPTLGENICADLSCKNAPYIINGKGEVLEKKDRKNGESWCVYDGYIGDGKDPVGSRHFKFSCIEGEVKTEPCADFRNEICVEKDLDIANGGDKFATAACRINNWQKCIGANTKGSTSAGSDAGCSGVDCQMTKVNVDKGFAFDVCTPRYPEGFDLSTEGGGESAKQICGMANQKCTVTYAQKSIFGGCKCVSNCNCEKVTFTQQMNNLCIALGDCGGFINILGKYTDSGYTVKKAPKVSGDQYVKYAEPVKGQMADPGNLTDLTGNLGAPTGKKDKGSSSSFGSGLIFPGLVLGAGGVATLIGAISVKSIIAGATGAAPVGCAACSVWGLQGAGLTGAEGSGITYATSSTGVVTQTTMVDGVAQTTQLGTATGVQFANAALAGGIAGLVTGLLAGMLKIPADGAMIASVASTIVGGIVGYIQGFTAGLTWGLIVGVALTLIFMLFKKKCKEVIVEFTCNPWQPPLGGADCEKCNANPLKPCSKYRCQSLGQACQFLNEGSDNELCISAKDDGTAPVIKPWEEIITGNFSYTDVTEKGFKLRQSDGGCIQAYSPLVFGISTDEASQCKIDIKSKTNFESMAEYFGGDNLFLYNHSQGFSIPSAEALAAETDNESMSFILDKLGNLKFYVRCQDSFGNFNPSEYVVDVCVRPGPDRTAPVIENTDPKNGAYIPFNETSKDVLVYINEPAECKYSTKDKNYSAMEKTMACDTALVDRGLCNLTLTNLTKGENTFYFRCRDQPFYAGTANESKRNENRQSYVYKLKVSENPLKITKLIPNGSLSFGFEPISLNLEAETSGGAENGNSICYYSFSGGSYIMFYDTGRNQHKQTFDQLTGGDYNINVRCQDNAGNVAESMTSLSLSVDSLSPIVTRVYNSEGSLYISTSEASECAYSYTNCNFIFANGTQMGGGFTPEHSTDWNIGKTYYIKCRDAWNNEPSGCSIKVRAYNALQ